MSKRLTVVSLMLIMALLATSTVTAAGKQIGINVVLNQDVDDAVLADLGNYGTVLDVIAALDAVTLRAPETNLTAIQALPYVAAANPDAERGAGPVSYLPVADFENGINTWDLDAMNVTEFNPPLGNDRVISYDGTGVYVAVLDTGLTEDWAYYFPAQRIATQYGISFGGGGGLQGTVSTQPDKWQRDTNSHGTHVTSTILGYSLNGVPVNGMAPQAVVIPVKVLNNSGGGWSSAIARGIVYVTELKLSGALGSNPVVINMSLSGGVLDAVEKAAVDYAVANGVIIVAAAANRGYNGMGYPGAYEPVISVAAAGWNGQFQNAAGQYVTNWWYARNIADPTNPADFHIADFSSRELAGQDLDVTAPGEYVVGPYQANQGQNTYYFLSGTSMASPHVAGLVALMIQKYPGLTAAHAEAILTGAATPFTFPASGSSCVTVRTPPAGAWETVCWEADAVGAGFITADAALAATP